jgi:hypothetical protein
MPPTPRVTIEREVLLFEIERRCSFADCNGRVFIGLTKEEALNYDGFECSVCERWNLDVLNKTDVPDWWDEIRSSHEPAN